MRRICWKRGMRLTDDIMRNADSCTAETIGKALLLAASGRFGLIPSPRPFSLSLNVTKGIVDVESLSCMAVTKGGDLIDVDYDTRYTEAFNTRVMIPDSIEEKELILTVNAVDAPWKETNNGFVEPVYSFALLASNTPVPDNAIPIARIVDEYGWRWDDTDFVPPCLLLSAHYKYEELRQRFADVLAAIDTKARKAVGGGATSAIGIFWPLAQQLRIAADKERDMMTPMALLSNVQKCVSAFTCACQLDPALQLADEKMYSAYVLAPYNYKDAYSRIKVGLDICFTISEKVEKLAEGTKQELKPVKAEPGMPPAPLIDPSQLQQVCKTPQVTIPVDYPQAEAIFFTIDGSSPNLNSRKATRGKNSFSLRFENGFKPSGTEPDKIFTIKLIALVNKLHSNISSYDVVVKKSLNYSSARPI